MPENPQVETLDARDEIPGVKLFVPSLRTGEVTPEPFYRDNSPHHNCDLRNETSTQLTPQS